MAQINTISILGTGWLGQPLAKRLQQTGFNLKLATRSTERLQQLANINDDNYQIDIANLSNTEQIQKFLNADLLIINITTFNLGYFEKLIQLIETSPVKYVIYISSTSVYRNTQAEVTEAVEFEDPNNAILQIEKLFMNNPAFAATMIRFSGLVDARRHPGRFFKTGRTTPQADAPINLIHLDDCLGIIDTVIQHHAWNEAFNGCSLTHPDKRTFYTHVRSLLGDEPPEFSDGIELKYKIINSDKIQQQLGYQFIHPDLMQSSFQ